MLASGRRRAEISRGSGLRIWPPLFAHPVNQLLITFREPHLPFWVNVMYPKLGYYSWVYGAITKI